MYVGHVYLTLSLSLLVSKIYTFHYDCMDLCEVDSAVNETLADWREGTEWGLLTWS
jgi:hypothetical protein